MKQVRWFSLIVIVTMLLSSCRATGDSTALDGVDLSAQAAKPAAMLVGAPGLVETESEGIQPNECLTCHADKDMLIATADPVEDVAESESSGVG